MPDLIYQFSFASKSVVGPVSIYSLQVLHISGPKTFQVPFAHSSLQANWWRNHLVWNPFATLVLQVLHVLGPKNARSRWPVLVCLQIGSRTHWNFLLVSLAHFGTWQSWVSFAGSYLQTHLWQDPLDPLALLICKSCVFEDPVGSYLPLLVCKHIDGRTCLFGTHWYFTFVSLTFSESGA